MHRFASSFVLALIVGAAASCSGEDGGSATIGFGCSPGQQVECACPGGGVDGVQICNQTGSTFGACMGCVDGSSSTGATSIDDSAMTTTTVTTAMVTTSMDTSGPGADESEVTGPPGGSESGGGEFAWVWIDHGGPAFLPPPCAGAAGVAGGLLVDPQAFFNALVAGTDPNDWEAVMSSIEPELWACGVGQQRDSGGNVRGRLFLPTDACPDAAPPAGDAMAMFLGVRQERACWAHFVDVVTEL